MKDGKKHVSLTSHNHIYWVKYTLVFFQSLARTMTRPRYSHHTGTMSNDDAFGSIFCVIFDGNRSWIHIHRGFHTRSTSDAKPINVSPRRCWAATATSAAEDDTVIYIPHTVKNCTTQLWEAERLHAHHRMHNFHPFQLCTCTCAVMAKCPNAVVQ